MGQGKTARVGLVAGATMAVWGCANAAQAEVEPRVTSPDGRIAIEFLVEDERALYRVTHDGEEIVAPSRLGFRFQTAANLEDAASVAALGPVSSVDTSWEQPWGERRVVSDRHNELAVAFASQDGDALFAVRARVFDDGLGFRYEVDGVEGQTRVLTDELTEFRIDQDSTTWWTPAAAFNRYEYIYETTPLHDAPLMHTPVTMRLPDGGPHVSIHEAALVDYSGMWVDQRRDGALTAHLAPAHDGHKAKLTGAFKTPWRTLQIADDAVGLANSDIILNLNEPNALGDVSWVEPMKYVGIWWGMHTNDFTWGSGPTHGATTERTKQYIDFAAEHGFGGVLVEGWNIGWDGDWFNNGHLFSFTEPYPDFDLEGLAAYAAEKGVTLVGHHETSADVTNYENQLGDALDLYERLGVKAIKTGYVADAGEMERTDDNGITRYEWHDGQFAVDHHLRVIQEAAERQITINTHEPVKDTGLRRTYPNWITREGARGMEFNAWGTPPNPPGHIAVMAFTRMLSGPMDFTPGVFNLDMDRGFDAENRVPSTLAKQLALYVVIYSPLQMAADMIENYKGRMDAFQFIKDVPVDWEESIALQGEVGDFIVTARQERGGVDWYLGAVTDEEARTVTVPLTFLDPGATYTAQIYRDGEGADWRTNPYPITIESREVTASTTLTLPLAAGGGAAVRFVHGG